MLWGGDATDKSVERESLTAAAAAAAAESTAAVFSNSIISFSPPLDCDVRPVRDGSGGGAAPAA